MIANARDLLAAFDALNPAEKQQAVREILRRAAGVDALPGDSFEELAAEVFRGYDAEEAARGNNHHESR